MDQNINELIKNGENDQLKQRLKEDPSLAGSKTESGITLLQFAAYCRNSEAVDLLREYKHELDIFEAASIGDNRTVSELLSMNPYLLNTFSTDGFTILGLASYFGHFTLVKDLLDKGADPNTPSDNQLKVAPLHSACAISNYEIAELLIQNGADVNAKQLNGVTPLHSASHNGELELSKLLINNGAEINVITDDGKTPLFMALEKEFCDTADFIINRGGQV
jgi:ankyrin repeat protein